MNFTPCFAFILFSLFALVGRAYASLDDSFATRISLAAAQNLLASPPLPTLDAGGQYVLSPAFGITTAKSDSQTVIPDNFTTTPMTPAYTADYSSKLTGNTAGLGLTSPTYGRFGYFAFAAYSSMSGEANVYNNSVLVNSVSDIKSQSFAGAAGMSYRFAGEQKSAFAAGLFLGPSFLNLDSSFKIVTYQPNSNVGPDVKFNISAIGAYSGLQARWLWGKFMINPYFLYVQELSKTCKPSEFYSQFGSCQDIQAEKELAPSTSFSGFGLFLGYGGLRLNAYSKANLSADMREFSITNYSLSYGFTLGK